MRPLAARCLDGVTTTISTEMSALAVSLISPVTHDYPAIAEINLGHYNAPDPEEA